MIARRLLRRLLPQRLALRLRREWLARQVASGEGPHFEHDIPLLKTFVKPTDVCWDIGANAGTYTLHLSRLAAQVFAFEPVPHSLEILRDVTRHAQLTNVVARSLALSDKVGRARMGVPVEGFYGGFYLASFDTGGALDVATSTIDALIAEGVPEPDFIKCDVEGAEDLVLDGARELLARRRPIWLLETFRDDIVPRMQSLGYTAHARDSRNSLVEVTSRVHERNYWFFPRR
jgi:FkbM family methyltransferase